MRNRLARPGDAEVELRHGVQPGDRAAVQRIVESTGHFSTAEVEVALELLDARALSGDASGYHFVFADLAGTCAGYACYGLIACTIASYDLYWIAVDPHLQGHGIGRQLLAEAEERIRACGGLRVYIETSCRAQYAGTRQFYERCGYLREAVLAEFYAPGDDKAIYSRALV